MGKSTANRIRRRNLAVMVLAYGHRYAFPILIPGCSMHFGTKENVMLFLGIGLLLYAAYSLAGYLLRWKHIFCSYQNAYHKKMTPDRINWNTVRKSDAYGTPLIFAILGILCIACYLFYA